MFNYIYNILLDVKNLADDTQSMCILNYIKNVLKTRIKNTLTSQAVCKGVWENYHFGLGRVDWTNQ